MRLQSHRSSHHIRSANRRPRRYWRTNSPKRAYLSASTIQISESPSSKMRSMARRIPGMHRCVDGRYDDDELASRLPGGTRTGDRYCTGRAGPRGGRDCLQGSGTHGFGRGGDFLEVFRLTRSGTEKSEFGGEAYRIDIFTIVPDTEFENDHQSKYPSRSGSTTRNDTLTRRTRYPIPPLPSSSSTPTPGGRFRSSIFVLGVAVRTFQLTVLSGSYSTNVVPNTTRRSGRRLSSRPVVGTERAPSLTLERHS